ncbi:MAG: sigma-70 family RNA polymerase sigma factor [Dysgonomonas sp.]|uniref:RNA polymerase sigma factor n=1 Tax=Dysgonomonas sp. TaxID=1891233 RepID=UPI0039E4595F
MTDFDDIHYINCIRNGEVNAFVHIVRRYQRMIYTIVAKIVNNNTDAEDIVQEIFIKVYQSLDKFRGDAGFSTWLYRIAYNTTITEIRKSQKVIAVEDSYLSAVSDMEISDSIDDISSEERLQYLDQVLKMLPAEEALLITMFYLNDHSIQEIGTITGLTLSNVKVKLHRIRKFMNFEINKLISQ